jgi:hypothetical protein
VGSRLTALFCLGKNLVENIKNKNFNMDTTKSKKSLWKRWWLWVIIIVAVIIVVASADNKKEPQKINSNNSGAQQTEQPKAPQEFKIGDTVKLGDYSITVNEVKNCASSNQFLQPKAGNVYVTADITQENKGADAKSYNLWDFKLQDDKDFSYQTAMAGCREPSFGSGTLQPNQKTRGYITFEIPKTSQPTQILFTPSWWSSDQIIIKTK